MRNLKRVLSMALATIMVLGMMVIGAGAASTYEDFTDKDEIHNKEAVNTMVSLGVLNGKEDGSYFDPTGIVTRGEMAKIIAVMLNGGKDPVLGNSDTTTFSDTKGHWAESYIAYCVNQKILAGRGDGTFGPNETVTLASFAKAMLCALGYRADLEGMVNTVDWERNTNALANRVKLYDGLEGLNTSDGLSRDNTAQLIYNAVQAQEVKYENLYGDHSDVIQTRENGTMLTNRFNVVKVTGILEANDKLSVATTRYDANKNQIGHSDYSVAQEGKSLLNVTEVVGYSKDQNANLYGAQTYKVATTDDMVGQEIVIYVKFLNKLSPNAVNSTVLGQPILTDNNTVVETNTRLKDADAVRKALRDGGMNNIGNPIAVLYDETDKHTGVVTGITDTIAEKAGHPTTDNYHQRSAGIVQRFIDNDGDGYPNYIIQTVPVLSSVNSINTSSEKYTFTGISDSVSKADVVTELDLERNDVVLMTRYADGKYYVTAPETVEGTVTAYNTNNNTVSVDGTSYGNSGGKMLKVSGVDQFLNEETVDNTYIFYLDNAGNVLGYKETDAIIGNYAIVRGYDRTGNASMGYSVRVKLLMQDGTTGSYDVNLAASAVNCNLAKAGDSTKTKEDAITVDSWFGNSNVDANGANVKDRLFSYTLDNNTVTLGLARYMNKNYYNADINTAKSTFIAKNTAEYYTSATEKVVANDQTVFFVKDSKGDYYVVTGLSRLSAKEMKITNGVSVSYTAPGTSTKLAKAIFVTTSDVFKSARDFVFVTNKYTRTTVGGTPVYTFDVVHQDGSVTKMDTKSSVNTIKEKVCEFDYDGKFVNFYPELDGVLYNQLFVKRVDGNTVTLADKDTDTEIVSLRVNSNADIWDVQDDTPAADHLSEDDIVSLITDTEGAVKAAYIYDVMNGEFAPKANIAVSKGPDGAVISDGAKIPLTAGDKITFQVVVPDGATMKISTDGNGSIETSYVSKVAMVRAMSSTKALSAGTWDITYTVTATDAAAGKLVLSFVTSKDGLDSRTVLFTINNTNGSGGDDKPDDNKTISEVKFKEFTPLVVGAKLSSPVPSTLGITPTYTWKLGDKAANIGDEVVAGTYTLTVKLELATGYEFAAAGVTSTLAGETGTWDTAAKTFTFTFKVEGKDPTPVEPSENYYAKLDGDTYKLYNYNGAAMTDDEVKAALAKAEGTTSDKVILVKTSGTVSGATILADAGAKSVTITSTNGAGDGSAKTPVELVKVTYNGNITMAVKGQATELKISDAKFIIDAKDNASKISGGNVVAVTNGKASVTVNADTEYAVAFKVVIGSGLETAAAKWDVRDANNDWVANTDATHVKKGTDIRVVTASTHPAVGTKAWITVEGEKVGSEKTGTGNALKFETGALNTANGAGEVNIALVAGLYTVKVNGTEVADSTGNKYFAVNDLVPVPDGAYLAKAHDSAALALQTVNGAKYYKVAAADDTKATVDDGVIELTSAYKVTYGDEVALYSDAGCSTSIATTYFVAKDTTVYVKAAAKNAIIGVKAGESLALTEVTPPDENTEGVWSFKMPAQEIAAGTIVVDYALTNIDDITDAEIASDKATCDVSVNGTGLAGKTIKVEWKNSSFADKVSITVDEVIGTTGKTTITLTNVSGSTLSSSDKEDLVITVGNLTMKVNVIAAS